MTLLIGILGGIVIALTFTITIAILAPNKTKHFLFPQDKRIDFSRGVIYRKGSVEIVKDNGTAMMRTNKD